MPKPLLPVLGIPTAFFAMATLADSGFKDFVVNIHHLPQLAMKGFKEFQKYYPATTLEFSDESQLLMGSGGGYLRALSLLSERFLSFNGDTLSSTDPTELLRQHQKNVDAFGCQLTLALVGPDSHRSQAYTEVITAGDRVQKLGSRVQGGRFFSGWAVFEKSALSHLAPLQPCEFVSTILEPLVKAQKVGFAEFKGPWLDVGTPDTWAEAHLGLMNMIKQKKVSSSFLKLLQNFEVSRRQDNIWAIKDANTDGVTGPAFIGYARKLNDSDGPRFYCYDEPKVKKNVLTFGGFEFFLKE